MKAKTWLEGTDMRFRGVDHFFAPCPGLAQGGTVADAMAVCPVSEHFGVRVQARHHQRLTTVNRFCQASEEVHHKQRKNIGLPLANCCSSVYVVRSSVVRRRRQRWSKVLPSQSRRLWRGMRLSVPCVLWPLINLGRVTLNWRPRFVSPHLGVSNRQQKAPTVR